jgi:hypothetical protein
MSTLIKSAIFLCIALSSSIAVHAKRLALVIGNDAYTYTTKLEKARNDADAVSGELKKFGFLVSTHKDLNYRGMVKVIDTFTNSISGGDEVVVFFAGHGVQIKSGSYLLPTDIEAENESQVEKTAYGLNELTEKLSEARASFSLVVIDACRDNPLKSKGRSVGNSRGLNAIEPAKGQMIVYSASRGQSALDRLGDSDKNPNSVFTREFIKKIQQPGVPIESIVRDLQVTVEEIARSIGHEQRPALYTEAKGDFIFTGASKISKNDVGTTTPAKENNSKVEVNTSDPKSIYKNHMVSGSQELDKDIAYAIGTVVKDKYPPAFYFDTAVQADENLFLLPKTLMKIGNDRINLSIARRKVNNFLLFKSVDEGTMAVAIDCKKKLASIHLEQKFENGKQSQVINNGNPEYMGLLPFGVGTVFDHLATFACQPHGLMPIIEPSEIDDKDWVFAFKNTEGNPVFFNKKFVNRYLNRTEVAIKTVIDTELKNNFSDAKTKFLIQRFRISCDMQTTSIDNEQFSANKILIQKGNAYGNSAVQKIIPNTSGSLAYDLSCNSIN